MQPRKAQIKRDTGETKIRLSLNIDGKGKSKIATGIPFFDHMLTLFAKHATVDLNLRCNGDIEVDHHHTVCLLYTSPSPRDGLLSRMPSSA